MKEWKPIFLGSIGTLGLIAVYFIIMTITNTFDYALSQFISMWYWFMLLSTGFGIQVGLYSYIHMLSKEKVVEKGGVAASGGISAGSMLVCCLHHVAELLPLLGLSAAAVFMTRFQLQFIIFGVFSNLIGIAIMLDKMQKHNLYHEESTIGILFKFNMKKLLNLLIVVSIVFVSYSFLVTYRKYYF